MKQDTNQTVNDIGGSYFSMSTFLPDILAKEIVDNNDFLFKSALGFYKYQSSGVFVKIDKEFIMQIIDQKLGLESKKSRIADVLELIMVRVYTEKELNPDRNLLNIQNGMFGLYDRKLLPHDKKYISTIQLKVTYTPDAKCPRWLKFLNEVLDGNKELIAIIQEFFGYCLVPDTRYEKMLLLVGDGANGKSTLISVFIELLGNQNISTVSLESLEKEFHRAVLYQKLVNVSTECNIKDALSIGYIKAIISGDPIDACFKFKNTFTFKPFARLVIAMNDLPRIQDTSYGFSRRLIIIPFNRRFEGNKADRKLKHKLIEELDGIFLWSLEGLRRLYENDGFTESRVVKEMVASYRRDNNPVETFVDECCEMDSEFEIEKSNFFKSYTKFCDFNGFKKLNNVHFSRELNKLKTLIPNLSETRPSGRSRYWRGIRLIVYGCDDTYSGVFDFTA